MDAPILFDAVGVQIAPGQRVVYAATGMYATGGLQPGTVVRVRHLPHSPRPERIDIRRDDGKVITICWTKRLVVLRQESEADRWLRRQLALLGAR